MSHVKFGFHSNLDTLIYFTAKNKSKSFVCIHGLKSYIETSDLVHIQIVSALTPTDFRHAWAIFGPLVDKNTGKGELMELPASKKFYRLFLYMFRYMNLKRGVYIQQVVWHMRFEFHHNQVYASGEFSGLFLNVLRYLLQSWFIHSVGCTTYWVYVSPEWGCCDLLHVLSIVTVN